MSKIDQSIAITLPAAQRALARGDISMMRFEVDELLQVFRINLDRNSPSYRKLAVEVLKQFIKLWPKRRTFHAD